MGRPRAPGRPSIVPAMSEPDLLNARTAYDAVAALYAGQFKDTLDDRPVERGLLAAFAEKVRRAPAGPVVDLGCGPGHIAAHLHGLGLPVLVLDEPTAQLDARAEVAFFDRFLELTCGLTTVVISHRFSTV
jgi:ABC-type sugar transport system ATPase subunit